MRRRLPWLAVTFCLASAAIAGPPFVTDDPEPVDFGHWEVYVASQLAHSPGTDVGTFPHLEVNDGFAPNLQAHIIVPWAFSAVSGLPTQHGMGDIELGVKWRFVQEGDRRPMIGVFPLVEVPTGSAAKGLGAGRYRTFLPVWVQRSRGPWTVYGGGGYWVNPGAGNSDYWLVGAVAQHDFGKSWTLGAELNWTSSQGVATPADTAFNVGGQYNFDEGRHLLFSVGRSIGGDTSLTAYAAFQWTFAGKSAHL